MDAGTAATLAASEPLAGLIVEGEEDRQDRLEKEDRRGKRDLLEPATNSISLGLPRYSFRSQNYEK